jgi:hypothetical protein
MTVQTAKTRRQDTRVIPIAASAQAAREEFDGQVPQLSLPLARREFLKGSGLLVGTLAAGSVLAGLAPSPVWAAELKHSSTAQGRAIMALGRTLYPHRNLPDAVYALLAKDLDAKSDAHAMLKDGLAALDKAAGGSFVRASPAKRLAVVKGLNTPARA